MTEIKKEKQMHPKTEKVINIIRKGKTLTKKQLDPIEVFSTEINKQK